MFNGKFIQLSNSDATALTTTTTDVEDHSQPNWVLDSVATYHLTTNISFFDSTIPYTRNEVCSYVIALKFKYNN